MATFVEQDAHFSSPQIFKKFVCGRPLQAETKQAIINVYTRLREQQMTITAVLAETSRLTGVSLATVIRLKSECKSSGMPRSPVRRSLDVSRKTRMNHITKLDDFDREAIRRKVHQFFAANQIPTVKQLLEVVNEDGSLPSFKLTTFYRILRSLNFKFRKHKTDSALITKPELLTWRAQYLTSVRDFRTAGRTIYYLDETWVNVGHTKTKLWHDDDIKDAHQAQSQGLTVGLTVPSGKGSRLIITHAGNENGFVTDSLDVFEGKKGKDDYHEEMDGNRFETWFVKKLLPHIKPHSVIVMDNASYHSVQAERIPTTKTKKVEIQEWLTGKGILWTPNMLVKDLLNLVASVRAQYKSYNIDKVAEAAGHAVLRLPPYHCELNPIELIWSQVKGYVAAQNKKFTIGELRVLVAESIARITPDLWKECVKHVVEKLESLFWNLDGMISTTM